MNYAISNCDIYTSNEVLYDKAVIIEGSIIKSIVDIDKVPDNIEMIDCHGKNLAPGFIDLKINGGGGILFNDDQALDSIETISSAHRKFGVTSSLLTFITDEFNKMIDATESIKRYMSLHKDYSVLGIHLEGPYISEAKSGIHDKKYIKHINEFDLKKIGSLKECIKIITIAPEMIDDESLKYLLDCGIKVFAGHTNSNFETCNHFFSVGGIGSTHLFNAMSQLSGREPGAVGSTLFNEKAYASIIADGYHVHPANILIAYKAMKGRLFLVTDAMPPVGGHINSFKIGNSTVYYKDGKCITPEGTIGGSSLDMSTAIRNCVSKCGIPLTEALRMSSTYQAEMLGLGTKLGKIAPGYHANLVIFDNEIYVKDLIINGKIQNINDR